MPPRAQTHISQQPSPQDTTTNMSSRLPNLQERRVLGQQLVKNALSPFKTAPNRRLSSDDLKRCRVTNVRRLDFRTGQVEVGKKEAPPRNHTFLCPMPPAEVEDNLRRARIIEFDHDIDSIPHGLQSDASSFWNTISCHLMMNMDETKPGFLDGNTPWTFLR